MEPIFDGSEGSFIEAKIAAQLQQNYLNKAEVSGVKEPIRAEFFGKKKIEELLNKPEYVGIRIYYAQTKEGTPELVLVATDKYGNNIVLDRSALKDPEGEYLSGGPRCPFDCPPPK